MSGTDVGTDGLATFEFWGMVPAGTAAGTYNVYFRPYHESGHWLEEWDQMNFTIVVLNSPNDHPNLSFEYDLDQNQQADNWNSFVQGGFVATYDSGSAPASGGCNPYDGGGSRIARLNNDTTGELSILHHDISGPWGALIVADTWYRISFMYRTDTPFHVRMFQSDVTSPSLDIGADVNAPTLDGGWHWFASAPFRPTVSQLNTYRKFGFRLNADNVGTLRIDDVQILNAGECYP
jgi:hypothetical protein